ncbi:MAG: DHA2 family efflux MFS transporter permease subunit [Eggerthellaceae bacterium]|nr:DHA2 family efflux MFS transporter permease subunit [Eggerthellaceae bacterium]
MEYALSSRQRNLIFINTMVVCIATSLLSTALTPALEPISESLDISLNTGQWITSGYSLGMGVIMPLSAFLIRRVNTKNLYLTCIIIYIVGLLIAIFAPNFVVLMVGRIFQAAGNGVLLSLTQVIILSIYPEGEKGTAMGWYGLALTAAPVIAPTLGGILVDVISWRAIFAIPCIIMAAALIMAFFVIKNVLDTEHLKFDVPSFILSIIAFGGITLGIGNLATYGLFSFWVWPWLLAGIVAFVIFTIKQLRDANPFLNMRVFKSVPYTLCVISNMIMYLMMLGGTVIMPLYVENVVGYSATIAGLVTLPSSLLSAIISPFAGKIYDKVGIRTMFIVCAICIFVGNLGLGLTTMNVGLWYMILMTLIRSTGLGALLMPLVTWGVTCVAPELVSDATAVINSFRTIAGSIGAAIFVGIMTAVAAAVNIPVEAEAQLAGYDAGFLIMAALSLSLIIIAVVVTRKERKQVNPQWDDAPEEQ